MTKIYTIYWTRTRGRVQFGRVRVQSLDPGIDIGSGYPLSSNSDIQLLGPKYFLRKSLTGTYELVTPLGNT